MKFAKGYFHWFYLIQPAPLPEKMIMADPKRWLKSRFNRSSKRAIGKVEDEYFRAFKQSKRIHATCEDYRAAATIDLEHDKKDRNKKLNIPIQVLWGKKGVVGKQFNAIKIWQKYTKKKTRPVKGAFLITILYVNNYFFTKNDVIITRTISPTNPPLPNPSIKAVRFPITSIPKTLVPVSTCQRIVTGKIAIIMPNNPPKNPETYFIIESMFILLKLSRFVAKLPLRFERLIIRI